MLAQLAANTIRYTLGKQQAQLAATPGTELAILNDAGEYLCAMHPWSWQQRYSVPLRLVRGKPWVDLPGDFGDLTSVMPTASLLQQIQATSLSEILELRTSAIQAPGLFTYYCAVEHFAPELVNLLASSEDFTAAAWGATDTTIAANNNTAPTGAATGEAFTGTGATSVVSQEVDTPGVFIDGRTYIFSVYLRVGTSTSIDVSIAQQGPGSTPETSAIAATTIARITWSGSVASASSVTPKGTGVHVVGAEAVTDGWYRVWAAITFDSDAAKPTAEVACSIRAGTGTVAVWGAQLERCDLPEADVRPSAYSPNTGGLGSSFQAGPAVRRLAIWPTPTADTPNALTVSYRRKWRRVTSELDNIDLPTFMDPLCLELCRMFARGYHREDDGMLFERIEGLRRSEFYQSLIGHDALTQTAYGPMRGLAHGGGSLNRDWANLGTVDFLGTSS